MKINKLRDAIMTLGHLGLRLCGLPHSSRRAAGGLSPSVGIGRVNSATPLTLGWHKGCHKVVLRLTNLAAKAQIEAWGRMPHIGVAGEDGMSRLDIRKLEQAIHYVSAKAGAMGIELDPVKLNKVLWYSDAHAFLTRGVSITGTPYIRKPRGPVPKFNRIAIDNLSRSHAVAPGKKHSAGGVWEPRVDSISEPDTSLLSPNDLQVFDAMIVKVGAKTSQAVSDRTHGEIWELANNDQDIPLYTVYAERAREPSPEHMELASQGL